LSFKVTATVRAARLPRTIKRRPEAKAILMALADRCDDAGQNAWPSVALMAAESEISPRTAYTVLETLRSQGIIQEQEPPRQHRPRTWKLNLDSLKNLAGPQHVAGLKSDSAPQDPAALTNPDLQISNPGLQNSRSDLQHVADDPVLLNSHSVIQPRKRILSGEEIEFRRIIQVIAKQQIYTNRCESVDELAELVLKLAGPTHVRRYAVLEGCSDRDYVHGAGVMFHWGSSGRASA
jgi:hypothetical protein